MDFGILIKQLFPVPRIGSDCNPLESPLNFQMNAVHRGRRISI